MAARVGISRVLGTVAALFLGQLAGVLGHLARAGTVPDSRPNLVVIVADDLGYGDTGPYGQQDLLTPNIDRLAAEGMRFTQAYAPSPICAPTRCSLLTGFHVGHCSVDRNAVPDLPIRVEDVTVGEVLEGAGYTTAWIGKWSLGGALTDGTPINIDSAPWNKGFSHLSYGFVDQIAAHDHYPDFLWRADENEFPEGTIETILENAGGAETIYAHDLLTAEARLFIEDHADDAAPFFLYLPYTLPHADNVSPPGTNPYEDRPWPEVEKAFAAMVTRLDSDIGEIVDLIDDLGLAADTLIIVTSDNGPQQVAGHRAEFFDSNGPLRGIKRDLYEGGIRVPFLARWPGRVAAAAVSDQVISLTDLLPTAAELAASKAPRGIDGLSIVPTLLGEGEQEQRPHLYWEHQYGGKGIEPKQLFAVRAGDLKYVQRLDGVEQLFDLSTDPGETTDLAGDSPEVLLQMRQIVAEEATGPPLASAAVLSLTGEAEGGGQSYTVDFGRVELGEGPVTRIFRVRNTAPGYAHTLVAALDDTELDDERLSLAVADVGFVVGGARSKAFRITLEPSDLGRLTDQTLVFTATQFADAETAVNSPLTLEIRGLVADTLFEDGFESGSTTRWSEASP